VTSSNFERGIRSELLPPPTIVLYCIVDGEDFIFKVKVHTSDNLTDLKRCIHEGIDTEYQVRSNLWKVSTMSMSVSILQFTSLGSSTNPYSSNPPVIWSIAYGNGAPTPHNLVTS
jgi:hypothetical protein